MHCAYLALGVEGSNYPAKDLDMTPLKLICPDKTFSLPKRQELSGNIWLYQSTCGLVAMTSASHAEGRQFDPGQVYVQNANKA